MSVCRYEKVVRKIGKNIVSDSISCQQLANCCCNVYARKLGFTYQYLHSSVCCVKVPILQEESGIPGENRAFGKSTKIVKFVRYLHYHWTTNTP